MRPPLRIENLRLSPDHQRVSALVDGIEIYFESDDVPLIAAPEAFAAAMLLPALQTRRPLVMDDPLDPLWLENAAKLSDIFGQWWDYPQTSPIVCDVPPPSAPPIPPALQKSIACFTGGIDSFHLQLNGDHPTDYLLYVHGYDIPLEQTAFFARFCQSLQIVAAELNKKPLILRTNLSQHPTFKLVSWERSHAAALGAVAQLLANLAGTFVIPSSYAAAENVRWGSNWQTDPLWSSTRVRVLAGDANVTRPAKIRALARQPLVQKHLRICHLQPPDGHLNCCRCYKCLRTMTILMAAGTLHEFTAFDQSVPLAERINSLPYLKEHYVKSFSSLLNEDLPPDVKTAWRGVFKRTHMRFHPSLLRRTVRKIRKLVR